MACKHAHSISAGEVPYTKTAVFYVALVSWYIFWRYGFTALHHGGYPSVWGIWLRQHLFGFSQIHWILRNRCKTTSYEIFTEPSSPECITVLLKPWWPTYVEEKGKHTIKIESRLLENRGATSRGCLQPHPLPICWDTVCFWTRWFRYYAALCLHCLTRRTESHCSQPMYKDLY